jgi:NADPH:quinone reductase-like Zn-dependent oxidoreductase
MRTVVMSSYGGPEVLALEEVAPPTPLLTEVRVRAIGANPVDTYVRPGAFPILKPRPFSGGTSRAWSRRSYRGSPGSGPATRGTG